MTNLSIIENKISSIKQYLEILNDFKKYSRKEIEEDIKIRGALERYLYLAAQAAIDLAEAVIAYKKLRKPTTLAESFQILNEKEIIPSGLKEKMIAMAGFRNIIAHEYAKINYNTVYDVLHNGLEDIDDFIEIISEIK